MKRHMLAFTWKLFPSVTRVEAERERVIRLIEGKMARVFLAQDRSQGWLIMLAETLEEAFNAAETLPFYPPVNIATTPLVETYPQP